MEKSREPLVAVYLSFKTFQAALANLRSHGLPSKLDRSAWHSRSGLDQSQILSAFKFLGLIDEAGNVQESLSKLVAAPENSPEEKSILKDILRLRYQKVFALNLQTATPMQFSEAFGSYNATGTTRNRAVRFFVKIGNYAGIELSKRLTRGVRTIGSPKRNGSKARRQPTTEIATDTGQQIKTILLPQVGGKLTVSGTFNAFELAGEERQLVYDIIDRMMEFERKAAPKAETTENADEK